MASSVAGFGHDTRMVCLNSPLSRLRAETAALRIVRFQWISAGRRAGAHFATAIAGGFQVPSPTGSTDGGSVFGQ